MHKVLNIKITTSEVESLKTVLDFMDGDCPESVWRDLVTLWNRANAAANTQS